MKRNVKNNPGKKVQKPIFTGRFILMLVIGFLLVAVIVLSLFVRQLWHDNEQRDAQHTASLILTAVDNLNWPAPTDPKTGVKYIPEAKVTLPPYDYGIDRLLYYYAPAIDSSPAELHLVSWQSVEMQKGPIRNATSVAKGFDGVSKLQACARGITVAFGSINGLTQTATKTLTNGQTVYFYTEPLCPNERLLDYAKQLDSY